MHILLTWLQTALTLTLLCSTSHANVLDPVGIYGSLEAAQQCLQTTWIQAVQSIFDDPASCLRLAFHDSGTYNKNTKKGGANGSVVMELNVTQFPVNAGLSVCGALVPGVVKAVHSAGCPNATVADVIQVMGAAAVATAGGPFCSMLMGRPDSNVADMDQENLPVQCNNVTRLLQVFSNYGFTDPVKALVTLSGAHAIGRARFTGTNNCSRGNNFMTNTPSTFNNHYFREVVLPTGRLGWFFSDRTLMDPTISPEAVRDLMITYANSNEAFMSAWCRQYRELSLLGVDPIPAGFSVNDGWVPAPWFQAPPPPDAPIQMPPSYPPPPASPGTVVPGTPPPGTPSPVQRPPALLPETRSPGTPPPGTPPPVPPAPVPKQQSPPSKRRPPPRKSPRKSPKRAPPVKSGCPRHQSKGSGGHSRTHHSA